MAASTLGTATVLRGDARALPLPDASVDLIVTSPPYYALRSYTDGGQHYAGQIGSEPTPAEYVDSLIACTREWMRVLKPAGSLWVNLGDKYAGAPSGPRTPMGDGYIRDYETREFRARRRTQHNVREKSLLGLPWRYALRCIDELGLILRAEVIWSKPNGLPESVTDRVRRSHETWFHLTKQPRYFSAVDEIRQPASGYTRPNVAARATPNGARPRAMADTCNPLGALPGSVWEIATQPLTVPDHLGIDHFAAFPMEWPRRIILGWSPSGICTACGEGRRPVVAQGSAGRVRTDAGDGGRGLRGLPGYRDIDRAAWREGVTRVVDGEACACPDTIAPTRPAVVLDPFGGTGTAALVARALGRHGISVDMSADYCRLAAWRTTDPGQMAAALQVPKPPRVADGQLDLFATEAIA